MQPVVKFSRNGVPPLCVAFHHLKLPFHHLKLSLHAPPELYEIQLIAKWLRLDGLYCIFGQLIFRKIVQLLPPEFIF